MANRKINELSPRTPTLTDLILVGDPSTGYSYKATISVLTTFVGNNIQFSSLGGVSITSPTSGQYLTFNGTNWVNTTLSTTTWDTAYNRSLTAAAVTGTTTKTLTLTKQDGSTLTATWSDLNTDAVTSVFGRTGVVVAAEGDYSLDQLSGVTITTPSTNQVLQYNGTDWVNATFVAGINSLNGLTATTQTFATGTSGSDFAIVSSTSTHTFNLPTASGTNRGALSSADWTTFNGKVGGSGTTNYVSKFTASGTIGNSQIFDNGTSVGIGTASPASTLEIYKSSGTNYLYVTNAAASSNNGVVLRYLGVDYMGMIGNFYTGELKIGGFNASTFFPTFYSNNAERMRLTPSGRLLIGTTTESTYILDANGTVRVQGTELRLDNGTTGTINLYSNTPKVNFFSGGGYSIGRNGTSVETISAGNIAFYIGANQGYALTAANGHIWYSAISGSAALARLTTGGNFMVGTITDAGYKLDVNGTGRFIGALSGTSATFSGGAEITSNANTVGLKVFGGGNLNIDYLQVGYQGGSASPVFRIAYNGAATFSYGVTATSFIPSGSSIPTNGMYLPSANTLGFATNSGNRLSIASGGAATFSGLNEFLNNTVATTSGKWMRLKSTGSDFIFGINDSTGISPFGVGGNYSTVIGTNNATDLVLLTNGVIRQTIASTGAATFSSTITTAAPSGGTAKPFKIGAAATVTPTSQNRTIQIEIDGTTYYLTAKTTND